MSSRPHVLIAGGGIGGLCLAQGLRRAGISFALYESSPALAQGGYRLHMNGEGGRALRQCLPEPLHELYAQTSRTPPRREVMVELDHQGAEVGARPHIGVADDPARPDTAVNRRTLRQIMAVGLDDALHFGHTVTGFTTEADGVRLHFADGGSATGDVLVGADGINSAVRAQLLPEVPVVDTGVRCLYALAPLTAGLAPALPDAMHDGFAVAAGPDGVIFAYGLYDPRRPVADAAAELAPGAAIDPVEPYLMINVSITPDSPLRRSDEELWGSDAPARHDLMRAAARGWHPDLAGLVEHVDPASIFPASIRHLRPAEPWTPGPVTLLGDAIHAMPPNFGAGGNTALRDAAALARALRRAATGEVPLVDAIAAYEADLRAEVFPILRAAIDPRSAGAGFQPDEIYPTRQ
ncbi:FAD-dependent monooxygenase [Actinoplanes sp. NPDC023936]|uniref:FAD-dependent oxidoreductase n=1 Tax=Actinoplanes sp. NPDC023936 TaxID=3154910 RepID=UPI0033C66A81